jgi:3-methyl-2-oxobutanoate hydroxymethyltransferase
MGADKVLLEHLHAKKERGESITMLTAYDALTARLMDDVGVDMILVGDSLGMVVHGFETTLPVTMDMMVMHCQAVRRGTKRAFTVGDMPFMSYQTSEADAKRNAARILAEGGMDSVKVEGGKTIAPVIESLVDAGVAVMGHIGLTPQSISALGRHKVQGKSTDAARRIIEDAKAVEAAGAFSIVLETIPARLAQLITRTLSIPTIGIGAGVDCDGQVLVTPDMLGMSPDFKPKHSKSYADLASTLSDAFKSYQDEVKARSFPSDKNSFTLSDEVWDELQKEFDH